MNAIQKLILAKLKSGHKLAIENKKLVGMGGTASEQRIYCKEAKKMAKMGLVHAEPEKGIQYIAASV